MMNMLTADCDGTVAVGAFAYTAAQLGAMVAAPGQKTVFTQDNPGTDSPAGCGANSDYQVQYTIQNATQPIANETTLAVARLATHLDAFWVGPDGSVRSNWWDQGFNNAQWNQPFQIAPPGSAAPGTVAAVARLATHLDAFWVGPDGSVRSNWWDQGFNNGQWNQPFQIAPPHNAARPGNG
jgi:hypothetical protein